MKTTMHPDVNYSPRVIAGTNGDVRGLNCLRQALMRNWTNEQKDKHAMLLAIRAGKLENEAVEEWVKATSEKDAFNCQIKMLKYHAIYMRLVEYRINLLNRKS